MTEFGGGRHTDIMGNRHLVHEGCDGIILYEPELISFRSGKTVISIRGRELLLVMLTDKEIVVEGIISSVNFGY